MKDYGEKVGAKVTRKRSRNTDSASMRQVIVESEKSGSKAASNGKVFRASELRYRRLFETAQDGILILHAKSGKIMDVNPFLEKLIGYSKGELLNKNLWEIGSFRDVEASKSAFTKLQREKYIRYENLPLQTKDGNRRNVEFVSNVYLVGDERVIQCNIRDITERVRLEERVHALSFTDDLTSLYNRRGFFALAEQQLRIAKRSKRKMLLFFIDIDNLKQVNDVLGHKKGDVVLIDVAGILK
ncbi:MAG: sensor domain-containing diguanylate cyclase, partial [Candidatus Ratteibacteria bacterium]